MKFKRGDRVRTKSDSIETHGNGPEGTFTVAKVTRDYVWINHPEDRWQGGWDPGRFEYIPCPFKVRDMVRIKGLHNNAHYEVVRVDANGTFDAKLKGCSGDGWIGGADPTRFELVSVIDPSKWGEYQRMWLGDPTVPFPIKCGTAAHGAAFLLWWFASPKAVTFKPDADVTVTIPGHLVRGCMQRGNMTAPIQVAELVHGEMKRASAR